MVDARVDALVIGGGVIGLAVARALALAGLETVIAERAAQFGMETSSRNSEVIHAGIYYPPGSLKARLCMEGRDRLYAFCAERGVPFRQCGKLIVATRPEQVPALEAILANAEASGASDLQWLDGAAVQAREPDILCDRAILSPSTGIIDSHAYMLALLGEAEAHGAMLACNTTVTAIRPAGAEGAGSEDGSAQDRGWAVCVEGADAPVLEARWIINCAGLWASEVAGAIVGLDPAHVPATRYAKGCYFSYSGTTRFSHLIYPVPEPGGLGTHLTLDMAGGARFGPDVEWIDQLDYDVSPDRHAKFLAAVQQFWPGVDPERLQPAYAGIRPKISGPGDPAADFRFSGPQEHGLPGIINLFGIESPGLTASLAIAEQVRLMVEAA